MKIAFLGLPLAACLLHADGHEIVLAGLSRTDTPGRRRLRRALGEERVLDKPALDARFALRMKDAAPDVLVSWFWTNKIPPRVLAIPRRGGFGVHPSLLPRHRGPDPTAWAILAGDAVTGVTAHTLEPEYDTGDVLGREELAIEPTWNAWNLARALDRPSLRVLRQAASRLAAGDGKIEGEPQDESLATSAPFLEPEACAIRWARPAEEIARFVRALAPAPGATMEIGDVELTVLAATARPPHALLEEPGELLVHRGEVLVACEDGALRIERAEVDGDVLEGEALAALATQAQAP